jgi:hypothetical protein
LAWRGNADAGGFECGDLRFRRAFAAADDRAGVTHAASGRGGGAGDEPGDRLLAILGDPLGGLFFRAAADFADHDDAVVSGSSLNSLMTSRCEVPLTGSPPMPTQVLWPTPARGELPDRFVSQRAAAGDDADVAFLVDVTGRDADAAAAVGILALAGRDDAGAVRADEPRLFAFHGALHLEHVVDTGMPSVMATTSSRPASTPSRMASAAKAGGTNIALAVAPVACFTASATVSKIGHFLAAVLEELAALCRA